MFWVSPKHQCINLVLLPGCFRYRIGTDPAGWLAVDKDTGLIKVRTEMDRESPFVKDGKYRALILALDNGKLLCFVCGGFLVLFFCFGSPYHFLHVCADAVPATGTGTLVLVLEDVNDNAPIIEDRVIQVCNKESAPVLLSVTDKDGPGYTFPFRVELLGDGKNNWTASMNDSSRFYFDNINY